MINNVGLVGVGRFGKVLANILKKGFHVKAYDIVPSKISGDLEKCELEEILKLDYIFIAVPIRYFEPLIKEVSKKINHPSTIIDVCSVKKHTSDVFIDETSKYKNNSLAALKHDEFVSKVDLLIVFGGDGTLLRSARKYFEYLV